jgi:hypothetical protein
MQKVSMPSRLQVLGSKFNREFSCSINIFDKKIEERQEFLVN